MTGRMAVRINTWQGKSPAGRGRKMFKKAVCMLAALVIGVCAMGTASAREAREEIQFTCVGAEQLWKEAAAGETAEAARKEGLEHPVAEDSLVASGARISREDGLIYMISSDAELGKPPREEEFPRGLAPFAVRGYSKTRKPGGAACPLPSGLRREEGQGAG